MSLFELTIGRILSLVEALTNFVLGKGFYLFKASISILALFFSFFLIWLWLKYELKNKDEINKWKFYLKTVKEYFFLKKPKKKFEEIKKIFYEDKILALKEINEYLNFVLEIFGYEGDLEKKIEKINPKFLPNLDDLKKAISIYKLIEEKLKNNEKLDLTEEDYLLIFHTYEIALKNLNVLTIEDFLVKNLD